MGMSRVISLFFAFILLTCNVYANKESKSLAKKVTKSVELKAAEGEVANEVFQKKSDIDTIKNVLSKINKPTLSKKKKYRFKSLMFSDEELGYIRKTLNSADLVTKTQKKTVVIKEVTAFGKIYLSSILYLSDDKWSIWVNGSKMSSVSNVKGSDIFIASVNPYEADVVWSLSPRKWRVISGLPPNVKTPPLNIVGQVEINIKLKSNQTYILKHDRVVNGKI
ncbi:MAG: hypothetical protein ACI9W5_000101 [Ulvibacter sp.]|jgi:hypothetical protein